jgi:class 3 adenylate cyclase
MDVPQTRYARSGDLSIAYQVVGDGPIDLVVVPGLVSHVEAFYELPGYARFIERLSSFARVITFDKRGTGLSDREAGAPSYEQRMDDLLAVMRATETERAALFGISEGGSLSVLFAATHPERTLALVTFGSMARVARAPDYEIGLDLGGLGQQMGEDLLATWGTGASLPIFSASMTGDAKAQELWGRIERLSMSPGGLKALFGILEEIDVRCAALPGVQAPTLVLHPEGHMLPEYDAYLAEHIPGARYVRLPGMDHYPWFGDVYPLVAEVEEFLTGVRSVPEPNRVLATVLFTDIVDSTAQAAKLGDQGWCELLERHNALVRRELGQHRGRELDNAGDGFLACFDGPARGVRCAAAIRDALLPLGIQIRAGLHTGECEQIGDRVGGIAVHIGARVAASAQPDEIRVSSTVKDLVTGSGIRFQGLGSQVLKGVPGEWQLYSVA